MSGRHSSAGEVSRHQRVAPSLIDVESGGAKGASQLPPAEEILCCLPASYEDVTPDQRAIATLGDHPLKPIVAKGDEE